MKRKSNITRISNKQRPEIIYELLGGSPADILLPNNFMIVEGLSDYLFLSRIIERFYPSRADIQIIFSEGDHETQRRSMEAISRLFAPLALTAIYRDRVILLCDAPHPERSADFEKFKNSYAPFVARGQLCELPERSLEEYYPFPYRKTADEVTEMGKKLGLKREWARHVSAAITQEEFEQEMPVVHQALERCWAQSY